MNNNAHHCPLRGAIVQTSKTGDHPDVFKCQASPEYCTLEPSNLQTANGPLANCLNCKIPQQFDRYHGDCIHRGEVVRMDVSNLCGTRGDEIMIFACAVHGECSLFRYCQVQTVKTCDPYRCKEFKESKDGQPK